MSDFYDAGSDPYTDKATGILRNKFGITDQNELDDAESDITSLEIVGLMVNGMPLNSAISFEVMKKIHKQLFGDIYTWAGEIRTINLEKDSTKFCEYRFIESEGARIFDELAAENLQEVAGDSKRYIERIAYYCSELNALHPFREGNGRTLRTLISILVMNESGQTIAWDRMDPQENIDACIYAYHRDNSKIEKMLQSILEVN